jgi:hypothetical protein
MLALQSLYPHVIQKINIYALRVVIKLQLKMRVMSLEYNVYLI